MKTLALELSSAQRSVAVVLNNAVHEVVETGPRSVDAPGMIEEALRAAQIGREQVECVAVGVGPGSYTGIRSAIAL
ncbi:MAG TPA: tRNA (adenosine(37)-N6)-threonylcarbamoyltransferase complex dimerization subunit type 1 TsaB, partial [Verrucomicrobiota bacterium]|nr:tRNA (adenosine(37)-N6)-threonylcarbamoyltransferase complex dimerization subunit type 1 TsaB [Verrucomicrobiota bacterium]